MNSSESSKPQDSKSHYRLFHHFNISSVDCSLPLAERLNKFGPRLSQTCAFLDFRFSFMSSNFLIHFGFHFAVKSPSYINRSNVTYELWLLFASTFNVVLYFISIYNVWLHHQGVIRHHTHSSSSSSSLSFISHFRSNIHTNSTSW